MSHEDRDLQLTASFVDELAGLCDRVARQISALGNRHHIPVRDLLDRVPRPVDRIVAAHNGHGTPSSQAQFVAMVSHELRNALTAVFGWSELLVRTQPDNRIAHEVMDAAGYTIELLDDLIDVGHLDRDRMSIKPTRVQARAIVDEAISMVQPEADRLGVTVSTHAADAISCHTDPSRVRQVLVNLLRNAIRHSGDDAVAVRLTSTTRVVEFTVEDHGNGMTVDQTAAFNPARASTDPDRGAGLGLMLSRRLAQHLGGELGVNSAPGAGARFILRIPRTRLATDRPAAEVQTSSAVPGAPHLESVRSGQPRAPGGDHAATHNGP